MGARARYGRRGTTAGEMREAATERGHGVIDRCGLSVYYPSAVVQRPDGYASRWRKRDKSWLAARR
jgi:hypothetical protein